MRSTVPGSTVLNQFSDDGKTRDAAWATADANCLLAGDFVSLWAIWLAPYWARANSFAVTRPSANASTASNAESNAGRSTSGAT